jgi:hypothetical protein
MAIKSALMTTGYDVLDGGTPAPNTNPVLIFRQGAGHVDPNKAADPGLVYNAGWNDWLAFLCGTSAAVAPASCAALVSAGYSTDPSNYNGASIAIGDLAHSQTVTRKVTNVGGSAATYTASFTGMTGFNVVVAPTSLTSPRRDQGFTVTFRRPPRSVPTPAASSPGRRPHATPWWSGRSPRRPPESAAPVPDQLRREVRLHGAFSRPQELVPAAITPGAVSDDPTDSTCSLTSPTPSCSRSRSAGTTYARFSLFDAGVNAGSGIGLCMFRGTTLVGTSGTHLRREVNLVDPTPRTTPSSSRLQASSARRRSSSTPGCSAAPPPATRPSRPPAACVTGASG